MTTVPMEAGDAVLFDAFEPHSAHTNESDAPRRSMKVVYGNAATMAQYVLAV